MLNVEWKKSLFVNSTLKIQHSTFLLCIYTKMINLAS
jgi:hypothetical protein